jgi:hypothetical protein
MSLARLGSDMDIGQLIEKSGTVLASTARLFRYRALVANSLAGRRQAELREVSANVEDFCGHPGYIEIKNGH